MMSLCLLKLLKYLCFYGFNQRLRVGTEAVHVVFPESAKESSILGKQSAGIVPFSSGSLFLVIYSVVFSHVT